MEKISTDNMPPRLPQSGRRVIREASPTEMIYISTGTTVVSRSTLAGAISRAQFEAAVASLEASHGILRSAVENGKFVERTDDRSSIVSWRYRKTTPAESVYAELLNAQLDTGTGVYSIHVIDGDDGLDVFLLSSHAVTDATSLVELHACLAHLCDRTAGGKNPVLEEQRFPDPIDSAVRSALASLPAPPTVSDPYSGMFVEIPMRESHDGRLLHHRLERIVIDADDMYRISTASHLYGASVHSLLLAAFAFAIRASAPGKARQILMRSNLDLRRRLEPHVSTQLVFSAISARITPIADLDRPLLEIARHIFEDIHTAVADGSALREYVNYPKSFGSPQQAPVALSVSDMQAVKFRWPTERLKVTGFEYALGWQKKYPNVSVSIYDGALVANIVYVEEFIDPVVMRAISERFVALITVACRNERDAA